MIFDKVNFGRQNCESMAVRISRSYKIVQNRAQFRHYYHPPSWSDLTTTTTSPNPVITAKDWAVHIQGQIQDFCRRGCQPFSVGGHQHIIFTKFSEKLLSYIKHPAYLIVLWLPTHKYTHIAVAINKATLNEIEKILVCRGVPGVPP